MSVGLILILAMSSFDINSCTETPAMCHAMAEKQPIINVSESLLQALKQKDIRRFNAIVVTGAQIEDRRPHWDGSAKRPNRPFSIAYLSEISKDADLRIDPVYMAPGIVLRWFKAGAPKEFHAMILTFKGNRISAGAEWDWPLPSPPIFVHKP